MISTTSEYALRALAQLARLPEGTAVLARDLAKATNVPSNYLSKILVSMRNAGILDSTRGSGGGYRLHKPAEEIFLIDVIELFEGSKAKPTCLLNNRECSEQTPCTAHRAWRELSMAYNGFLISTSLASIAGLSPTPPGVALPASDDLETGSGGRQQ